MRLEDRLKPAIGNKERWTGSFFDVVVTKLGESELYEGRFYVRLETGAGVGWLLQYVAGPLPREKVLLELEEAISYHSPVLASELKCEAKSALARVSEEEDPF